MKLFKKDYYEKLFKKETTNVYYWVTNIDQNGRPFNSPYGPFTSEDEAREYIRRALKIDHNANFRIERSQ